MKHTILACVMSAGLAWAQSPAIIQNTRNTMQTVQHNATTASNEALGGSQKPAAGNSKGAAMAAPPAKATVAPMKASPKSVKVVSAQPKSQTAVAKHAPESKPAKAAAVSKPAPKLKKAVHSVHPSSPAAGASQAGASESEKGEDSGASRKFVMTGKRDPFISPVVSHTGGSGCSSGKKCLEIGNINLRGVVHAEVGFIAVVTNNLNKAYFLRENDPVFNGYVVRITGDSITFKEMMQDRLGKPFTREVVKRIVTPAV
jgi:hypothetical protein